MSVLVKVFGVSLGIQRSYLLLEEEKNGRLTAENEFLFVIKEKIECSSAVFSAV